jgi:hypothetical protein
MSESKFWRCVYGAMWVVYMVIYVALILIIPIIALWFFGNLFGNFVAPMGGRQL